MIQTLLAFYNSPIGRRLINWGVTALGLLIQGGVIKLDAPIPHLGLSLGTLITALGLRMPSVSTVGQTVVTTTVTPAVAAKAGA